MSGSRELGIALRRWRDRLTPEGAGLPDTVGALERRRATGLRREELALLAGVSVDYVTRLEQGRSFSPSPPVLAGLARALRLSEAEREHLFLLAGQSPPRDRHASALSLGAHRLLEQLDGVAASAYDAAWNLISWNRHWIALNGDAGGLRGRDRNVVWCQFTGRTDLVTHTEEQQARLEAALVSDLRAATIRYPDDGELRDLVADLHAASPRFAGLWDAYVIAVHTMSRKTLHHPVVGPLHVDGHVLMVPDSDIRIVTHTAAPGSDASDKLKRLYAAAGC
ncbi:helix-turn-helix transcriptional regulator [Streptomyces sp. NPDC002680]|uniref:helix-turn-helix transcriptional regulator n=1 Tax=Streptomyces sp. NPDC002680 TaxID=3364659 RepID=UPI0036A29F42